MTSFLWLFNLILKGISDFNMVGLTIAWVLPNIVVAITCWQQSHGDSLWGVHSPSVSFGVFFINFRLPLVVFAPMICLNDVFLRNAITVVVLNTSPNVLSMFDICQCFLISSLIFKSLDFMLPKMKLCFPYPLRLFDNVNCLFFDLVSDGIFIWIFLEKFFY